MDGYSQAIYALDSTLRTKAESARVTSLAAWLLPNFAAAVFAVTLFQVLFLSAGSPRLFHDSDTGWHVRNGEVILSSASVPRVDRFSYTRNGQPWFAWEWLSDAIFGASHRIAGLPGVALIAALAIALTAWGAARLALSSGGNLFFAAIAIVLLLGITSMHWLARPHVFSWILALVFLSTAEHERSHAGPALYVLPLLALLWANMHGSFLLGPAILFIYAVGEGFSRGLNGFNGGAHAKPIYCTPPLNPFNPRLKSSPTLLRFAAASLASLLATFINPYGWRLHEHIFTYLQNDYLMDHISEFRSFSFHSAGALYIESFLAVAVLGTVALVRQRAFGPALLSLGMLHISVYSARHLPTAAVLLLPLSVAALTREAKTWPRLRPLLDYSERLRAIDRRIYGVVPMVLVLAISLLGMDALARAGRVGFDDRTFPVRAADFLEQRSEPNRGPGRIFAKDQWSGYLIYRFPERVKVFIDGRSDFYGQNLLETYAQVTEVRPGWDAVLKQHDVRFVLVPPDNALAAALQLSPGWKRIYADWVATVYERVG